MKKIISSVSLPRSRRLVALIETLESRSLFSATLTAAAPAASLTSTAPITLAATAADDVKFSHKRGFYSSDFDLVLSTSTDNATIRYTLDGSAPTASSGQVFNGPIHITTTTVVRAIATASGVTPSTVATNTYLYVNDIIHQPAAVDGYPSPVVNDDPKTQQFDWQMDPKIVNDPAYTSDLIKGLTSIPSLMISVPKGSIFGPKGFWDTKDVEVPISMEYIDPANPGDNTQINAGVEGHADLRPKRSLRVQFKKIYGEGKLDTQLLQHAPLGGDTAENEIDTLILRAGNNRAWATALGNAAKSTFVEDELGRQNQIAMTGEGVHGTFVHLYINGLYFGMYNAAERPDEGFGEIYYGSEDGNWFSTNHDNDVKSGNASRWNYMVGTLSKKNMATAANYNEMKTYLDVEQFADYIIAQSWGGVSDWPNNNFWAGGDTATKMPFKFFVWDAEHMFTDISGYPASETPYGAWLHPKLRPGDTTSPAIPPIILWRSLVKSPEFLMLLADRTAKAVAPDGALSDAATLARFDKLTDVIRDAIVGESARWGDAVNKSITRTRDGTWQGAVNEFRGIIPGNGAKLITELRKYGYFPSLNTPTLSKNGGLVDVGYKLTITNPQSAGTLYYTTDGSDPRLAGGGLNPNAKIYNSSTGVIINTTTVVNIRVKTSGEWSALREASFGVNTARALRVTEMMYHPQAPAGSPLDSDEFEFLELKNTSTKSLNLNGFVVSGGIDFTFGDVSVPAGGYVVIVRNQEAFESVYGTGRGVVGKYSGKLDNKGERILITAPGNVTISDFTYQDAWYPATDGDGYSMIVMDPTADPATLNTAAAWGVSGDLNGTPGGGDSSVNAPPQVSAGTNQVITLPAGVTLNGSASDATIPFGGALATTWSLFDGPGTATFADPAALNTTATFSVAGTYVLRLTATDGTLVSSDDITITVLPVVTPPTPTNGSISGFAFNDNDKDGVYDANEVKTPDKLVYLDANQNGKRDAGEKYMTTTGTNGAFSFTGLAAGVYYVRREFPKGYTYSTQPLNITLAAGQTVTGLAIGSKTGTTPTPPTPPNPPQPPQPPVGTTGSIRGVVFADNNGNGKQDSGDGGMAGKVVFLDLDGDNVLDSNEKSTTTNAAGEFTFTGLAAGNYSVRRVFPKGYKLSGAPANVTLTAGQNLTGVKIGTRQG